MAGRVAVVTGGTMGIGRATARMFAEAGWSVGVVARDAERLRATEAELRGLGVGAVGIEADVADAGAVEAAAARIEDALGPIEAWVNNAMATVIAPAADVSAEEFRRVTEVTYLGQVHGTLAALRRMRPRGRGVVVQVSSGLAIRSAPLQSAYCGAKAAVRGFTDSLRAELLHERVGIALAVVYLPAVNTPQFDVSRNHTGRAQRAPDPVFDPRLAARAIVFAAEHPRREIWVGRSVLQMDLVQRVAPALGDRVAAGMWDRQLEDGAPETPAGNLSEPVPGDRGVDGRFSDRTRGTEREFFTSRQRDAALAAAATVMAGAALLPLAPLAFAGMALGRMRRG